MAAPSFDSISVACATQRDLAAHLALLTRHYGPRIERKGQCWIGERRCWVAVLLIGAAVAVGDDVDYEEPV